MQNQAKTATFLGNPLVALLLAVVFGAACGLLMGADFPEGAIDDEPDAGVQVETSIEVPLPIDLETPLSVNLEELVRRTDPGFRGGFPEDLPCTHHLSRIW